MATKHLTTSFAILGAMALSSSAWAFRCGNSLIDRGDYEFEANQKCGEPVSSEWVVSNDQVVKQVVYDVGEGRYYRIVNFRGGKVVDVTDGPRK